MVNIMEDNMISKVSKKRSLLRFIIKSKLLRSVIKYICDYVPDHIPDHNKKLKVWIVFIIKVLKKTIKFLEKWI